MFTVASRASFRASFGSTAPAETSIEKISLINVDASQVEENSQRPPISMRVSTSRSEREEALRLVHRVYCQSGLIEPGPIPMRLMRQHLSSSSDIIVGVRQHRVEFTASLIGDGEYGLPMESLFSHEIEAMRRQGLRMAEVSCLAHAPESYAGESRFDVFVSGISLVLQVARRRRIDRILLAVHPRHAKFYERMFGCERYSMPREYAAVLGNPAVLCVHDFDVLDQSKYPLYKKIYTPQYTESQMDGQGMTDEERDYFEQYLPADDYQLIPMAA